MLDVVIRRVDGVPVPVRAGPRLLPVHPALLDAFDVVAVRPPRQLTAAAMHQLAARVRLREVVLVPYLAGVADWSGTDVRLTVSDGRWFGTEDGYGRLRQRRGVM